jgi:membrane protein implicated in regulation of membrane protease activity
MSSKKSSMLEVACNTGSGFVVSYAVTATIHSQLSVMSPLVITGLFTVVSLVRSYAWRRFFVKKQTA